jgi:hypothetical protein
MVTETQLALSLENSRRARIVMGRDWPSSGCGMIVSPTVKPKTVQQVHDSLPAQR